MKLNIFLPIVFNMILFMLQDVLQQFIVMKLPNVLTICKEPGSGMFR